MFVAEHIMSNIVDEYDLHLVSTDGGTWYPQACDPETRSSHSFSF